MGLLYSWKVEGGMDPTNEENGEFHAIAGEYEGGALSRKSGR